MNRLLMAIGIGLALLGVAFAQGVNTVPQVGVISAFEKQYTYSAVSIGLVPPASATDIFCISGSGARAISIKQIRMGLSGTAAAVPITLLRRASLDTGGTAATSTAAPVAAPNMSTDPASSATLIAYTAVPTIVDASPVYLRTSKYVTAAATAQGPAPIVWQAGEAVSIFSKAFNIPKGNVVQQICINMNATTVTSPVADIDITWIEQ